MSPQSTTPSISALSNPRRPRERRESSYRPSEWAKGAKTGAQPKSSELRAGALLAALWCWPRGAGGGRPPKTVCVVVVLVGQTMRQNYWASRGGRPAGAAVADRPALSNRKPYLRHGIMYTGEFKAEGTAEPWGRGVYVLAPRS